jgi:hypothetical protein
LPATPAKPGHRVVAFEFPTAYVDHLDTQARLQDRTRAAYLRRLIATDMDRCQAEQGQR